MAVAVRIVASAIAIGSGPILARLDTATEFGWGITAVSMVARIWFAKKVSAESFRHSLLFICLAAALHVQGSFIPPDLLATSSFASPLPTYLVLLIGGVILKGIAVWTLVNTQYVVSIIRTLLPAVITTLLTGSALVPLAPSLCGRLHQLSWMSAILSVGASSLLFNVLVIAIAYATQIREPRAAPSVST